MTARATLHWGVVSVAVGALLTLLAVADLHVATLR
jgi:hypothetical protein